MKYITQDWTSTKDGYLFFVQRLQEMLFHYSDDIVKAPVHNTQTLLEEYVDTEKDVVKGSIKQYQLDIIAKEIKSSLMTDVIVRELYKYEVIEEMAKFLDKDQRTAVHYIFNKIPKKKYYEICCKYLKENLSESNRKTEIEKGLRAWLAFLLWHGYSSEYIYRFLRNIFEESINDPEKKAQIFLNRFDFEIGKYKVYFVFYEKLKKIIYFFRSIFYIFYHFHTDMDHSGKFSFSAAYLLYCLSEDFPSEQKTALPVLPVLSSAQIHG